MTWRVVCDRCGFKRWNTDLRREWQGLMVCRDTCWEPRQPQDRVRGKADRQNPPWVRPEPADVFQGPTIIRLTADALAGATSIQVSSFLGLEADELISVMLDSGETFLVSIAAFEGTSTIHLFAPLPGPASTGNIVVGMGYSVIPGIESNLDFSDTRNSHHIPTV